MSNRITNKEIEKIHSYMEEIDNPDFVILLRKLLTTFNFLALRYMDLTQQDIKAAQAEVKFENERNKNKDLKEQLLIMQRQLKETQQKYEKEQKIGENLLADFERCVYKNERLQKRIEILERGKNEVCDTCKSTHKKKQSEHL